MPHNCTLTIAPPIYCTLNAALHGCRQPSSLAVSPPTIGCMRGSSTLLRSSLDLLCRALPPSSTQPPARLIVRASHVQSYRSKEVADGGVSYYIEGFVTHRVIKQTYGSATIIPFLPFLPDHKARAGLVVLTPRGPMIPRGFAATLVKVRLSY